jgi:hypothetical protein
MDYNLSLAQAYETLWDDVIDVFTQHTNALVLDQACQAMTTMRATSALSQTNDAKVAELDDALVKSLAEVIADKDAASASFDVDALRKLDAIVARLAVYNAGRDITSLVETGMTESTSVFQVLEALAGRGRLGYEDEEAVRRSGSDVCNARMPRPRTDARECPRRPLLLPRLEGQGAPDSGGHRDRGRRQGRHRGAEADHRQAGRPRHGRGLERTRCGQGVGT